MKKTKSNFRKSTKKFLGSIPGSRPRFMSDLHKKLYGGKK